MPVFMFTDIEDSTKLWEKNRQAMPEVLHRHDTILEEEIARHDGRIIDHMGDGVYAVFEFGQPLHCALAIQQRLAVEDWPDSVKEVRTRIGMNGRPAHLEGQDYFRDGDDYFGPIVNHTARITNSAWGGQILLTPQVLDLAEMPPEAELENLGTHQLRSLKQPQTIYQLRHPTLALHKFPPLRSISASPNNLPTLSGQFIGRQQELAKISDILQDEHVRLVTLSGPGGVGKTRLALAAANQQLTPPAGQEQITFSQGVFFVPLAAINTADHIVAAIANALSFSFYKNGDSQQQLVDYLRYKKILLVLDNFEQLIDQANLVQFLLNHTEQLKLIITSRERLNLHHEWVLEVEGMAYPDEDVDQDKLGQYAAIQLFLTGIHRVNPGYQWTEEDHKSVVQIARLLGGNALGLELASAWTRSLSPTEILQEIECNFDFLDSSVRAMPERHRSLSAVFENSWSLLSTAEQDVLARLSIFQGGFRRASAEQVAGAAIATLSSLLDKSFLRRGDDGRYLMHQTVKQYSSNKLGQQLSDVVETRNKHCLYYADFIFQRQNRLRSRQQKQALIEVAAEIENIRAGWLWALEQQATQAIGRYIEGLANYYWIRGWLQEGWEVFAQGVTTLTTAIAVTSEAAKKRELEFLLGLTLARQGSFSYRLRQQKEAKHLLQRSLEIFFRHKKRKMAAYAYCYLGAVSYLQNDYPQAKERLQQSLSILQDVGGNLEKAIVLHHLGMIAYAEQDYEQARQWHSQSLIVAQEIGEPFSIAISLNHLGMVAHAQGSYGEARQLHQDSLAMRREIEDRWGIASSLSSLGLVAFSQHAYEEAETYLAESRHLSHEIGDRRAEAEALRHLSQVAEAQGQQEQAREMLNQYLALLSTLN